MTYQKFAGPKYAEYRDTPVVELAKLMRAEVKAAKAAGLLPADLNVSIRYREASMMCAVDIEARDRPDLWAPCNGHGYGSTLPGDQPCRHYSHAEGGTHDRLTVEGARIRSVLEAIRKAYDGGEIEYESDYFNVRYYGDTLIEDAGGQQWRLGEKERLAVRRARKAARSAAAREARAQR